jgi:hypothetical protein
VTQESVRLFVESWTMSWTLVLGLGYIGQMMAWPALSRLGRDGAMQAMVVASLAVVFGLCAAGYPPAGLSVSGWAIGLSLLRRVLNSPE